MHSYRCHGVSISVCGDSVAASLLHSRLKYFSTEPHDAPDLVFEFSIAEGHTVSVIKEPLGPSRTILEFQHGTVLYEDAPDQVYMDYDHCVRVQCDVPLGHAHWAILQREDERWRVGTHLLFRIAFIELLKRRGRYSLHAAGLHSDGKGLLIAGISGSGKTTLTIALLKAGFDFLGDDLVFLMLDQGLRVGAFPEQLGITESTAHFFPELAYLLTQPRANGMPKREIDVPEVFRTRVIQDSTPSVIIFPRIANTRKSTLIRIGGAEALLELVSNVLLTEPLSSQAHLDILGKLARESRCYRLDTGRDLDEMPKMLQDLLSES